MRGLISSYLRVGGDTRGTASCARGGRRERRGENTRMGHIERAARDFAGDDGDGDDVVGANNGLVYFWR